MKVTERDRAWLRRVPRSGPFEDVWTPTLFRLAHEQLGQARGVDRLGAAAFSPGTLERVCAESLVDWRPRPLRWVAIPGRDIGIPCVDDQLVVAAWRLLAEPRLDRQLAAHVHGYRHGHSPARAVAMLARGAPGPAGVLVRTDIRRMFESLDHGHLLCAVDEVWPGASLGRRVVERAIAAWSPGYGVPTGAALSPALSNAALRPIDAAITGMQEAGVVASACRYADDFASLVSADAARVLGVLAAACASIGLVLNPAKTRILPLSRPEVWPTTVLGVEVVPRPDGAGILIRKQTPRDRRYAGFFR